MANPIFEELLTPRLRVRRFRQEDASALAIYRDLPEVSRYQSWEHFSESEGKALIATMADAEPGTPGQWFQFAVALRETDELVGDIGLLALEAASGSSWIGFSLDPRFAGRGYMTEAVRTVLNFIGAMPGFDVVRASCDPRNERSVALLRRLSFTRLKERPSSFLLKGELVDDWIFERPLVERV